MTLFLSRMLAERSRKDRGGGCIDFLYRYVDGDPASGTDPLGLRRDRNPIKEEAEQRTRDLPGRHNGVGDAIRHCLASCMMTRENSAAEAWAAGWANEIRRDWTDNQEVGERAMDVHNNAVGRRCARGAKDTDDCLRRCVAAPDLIRSYQSGTSPKYFSTVSPDHVPQR